MDANSSGNDDDSLFDRLPPDVAMLVFNHLELQERVNARLVSQRWNDLALSGVQLKLRINAHSTLTWQEWQGSRIYTGSRTTTTGDFVSRSSSKSIEPRVEVPGASLNQQIKQLPEALMDRVFDIELRLDDGCVPATGILDDIVSRISRPVKLHLDVAESRLTPSVFTNSAKADASLAEEFPTLRLHSLSTVFTFQTNNDFSALNYFRTDKPSKNEKNINLKLRRCGQSSNELPGVIERFPQLTTLEMQFGDDDNDVENRFEAEPDWQKLSQLTRLQKLMINGDRIVGLSAPKLSTRCGLPELRILHLANIKLPPSNTFFQGTPNLNLLKYDRCEHGNNGPSQIIRADIQAMTSAMRSGHLKKLTDVTVTLCCSDAATATMVCNLVSANHPLSAITDNNKRALRIVWTKKSEGYVPQIEMEIDEPIPPPPPPPFV